MTDTTEITYYPESGRTRFANYRDGKLVSIFWREDAADKRTRRYTGRRSFLDQKEGRD